MTTFTVIIIGGSIAGLTLANILERYRIEYIVLEKHSEIAPQLGASVGLLPHGTQILDQLGLYEKVLELSEPVRRMKAFGPDGTLLSDRDTFGEDLEQVTGYQLSFLDRRELIQVLYDNLPNKSKVHVSKELATIEYRDDVARVMTKDGALYVGSLVVGADGVHSQTRNMKCSYRCLFGIADRDDRLPEGCGYKSYHQNRSYLCQAGRSDKLYIFAFFKNPEARTNEAIPRYASEDHEEIIRKFGKDIIFPGQRLNDLYDRCRHRALVPVEEYVLERCFYQRSVLIGDSLHKINPITAQGANAAIEDAALLGDLLKEAVDQNLCPTTAALEAQFSRLLEERRPKAETLIAQAHSLQGVEALENPFLRFVTLSGGAARIVYTSGHTLRYMPEPSKKGEIPRDKELRILPNRRPDSLTAFWTGLMLSMACINFFTSGFGIGEGNENLSNLIYFDTLVTASAVSILWTIESWRPMSLIGPLAR
ncbi:FAD/NAD(P)-binding domain-containing protein [Aspergillus steynii IBT 23096]|uniref:FAD/NAD(P)-binding domain-containing protein n=1 Tax=Aspergillus steynii IBT 23096 TaxID=1392250 RepID=A0A2I2G025_9EURO|nr:FAD/NAD(P)-binding domain-containing protein [Aspergillus steynii IBT 23096]PLB46223.1 FAD/NAD(P)-binding domain-containing protein [Aspergillus steynii IBT 23096]